MNQSTTMQLYQTLALISDTQNYTTNYYIFEFTKLALYKTNSSLTIQRLKEEILNMTSLEYSSDEILEAIKAINDGEIQYINNEYTLTHSGAKQYITLNTQMNYYIILHYF